MDFTETEKQAGHLTWRDVLDPATHQNVVTIVTRWHKPEVAVVPIELYRRMQQALREHPQPGSA